MHLVHQVGEGPTHLGADEGQPRRRHDTWQNRGATQEERGSDVEFYPVESAGVQELTGEVPAADDPDILQSELSWSAMNPFTVVAA